MGAVVPVKLEGDGSSGTASSYTTGKVPFAKGRPYLVAIYNRKGSASDVPSISGGGLTWTQLQTREWDAGATRRRITVFKAEAAAGAVASALTISFGASQTGCCWQIIELAHADTTAAFVQSAQNGGTGLSGSVTLAAFGNANNATVSFWGHSAQQVTTPEASPWVEVHDLGFNGQGQEAQFNPGNDTSPTASWATSSAWGGVAVEVKQGVAPGVPTALHTAGYADQLGASQGTEYYVDFLNGNDTTGAGTLGNPWKTIEKAIATISAAEDDFIINLRYSGGTEYTATTSMQIFWQRQGKSIDRPNTIRTYPGDLPNRAKLKLALRPGGTSTRMYGNLRIEDIEIKPDATAARGGGNVFAINGEGFRNLLVYRCKIPFAVESGIQYGPAAACMRGENIQIIGCEDYDVGTEDPGNDPDSHDHPIYIGATDVDYGGIFGGCAYNNLFYRAKHGFCAQIYPMAEAFVLAYNTLYDANQADNRGNSVMVIWGTGPGTEARGGVINNVITSNILARSRQDATARNAVESAGTGSGNLCKYNLPFEINGTTFPAWAGITHSNNLAEADPLFADAANGNFAIGQGSPAIDAGEAAFLPATDFYGNTRTTKDIGAIAYVPASSSSRRHRMRPSIGLGLS